MLSKLFVIHTASLPVPPVRLLGGLTPLEKFEKLKALCCTSDVARRRAEAESQIRPRTLELEDEGEKSCSDCNDGKSRELLDIRCKTAMVLGGAAGIGLETADYLLKGGALRVIIADINQCAGVQAVKKLCSTHGNQKAVYLMTDVRRQPSIEMAFKEIYRYFCQIDIYVNCVRVYNETPQCWDKMVRTNLSGCVRGTLLAHKYMSGNPPDECGQGTVIVNVSSFEPIANLASMPMFSAASNGIIGLTSSFGHDFHFQRSKVRCVAVCPSCTDSGLLRNSDGKHYNRKWASHSNAAMKTCSKQSAKVVGNAIVNAIRFGVNGCVYVVKDGKYYRYAMPDYVKIMRQETILL